MDTEMWTNRAVVIWKLSLPVGSCYAVIAIYFLSVVFTAYQRQVFDWGMSMCPGFYVSRNIYVPEGICVSDYMCPRGFYVPQRVIGVPDGYVYPRGFHVSQGGGGGVVLCVPDSMCANT